MKFQLFSIYDRKTEVYTAPMCFHNAEHAKRDMRRELMKDTMLSQFPEDYELVHVGSWDDTKATLEGLSPTGVVCRLSALMKPAGETPPDAS